MSEHDRYSSPLAERYASKRDARALVAGRRATASGDASGWRSPRREQALGVSIPDAAIAEMRAHLDDIDFAAVGVVREALPPRRDGAHPRLRRRRAGGARVHPPRRDERVRHRQRRSDPDAPRAAAAARARSIRVLRALAAFAREWRARADARLDAPPAGAAHDRRQARRRSWMQDLVLDLADLDHRIATLPCRGVKGTTGTQASFLEIFGGDHAKVRELDRRVTAAIGFAHSIPVSGQTYTRKLDAQMLGAVAGIAASAAKFSGDLRVLQSVGEIEEPFEKEQVGSSAMAYKRNPMRCERIASLARFVHFARAEREPDAQRAVLRAHARRQREPAPRDSRGVPGDRRDSRPDGERRARSRGAPGAHSPAPRRRAAVHGDRRADRARRARRRRPPGRARVHPAATASRRRARSRTARERNDLLDRLAADPRVRRPDRATCEAALDPQRFVGRAPSRSTSSCARWSIRCSPRARCYTPEAEDVRV